MTEKDGRFCRELILEGRNGKVVEAEIEIKRESEWPEPAEEESRRSCRDEGWGRFGGCESSAEEETLLRVKVEVEDESEWSCEVRDPKEKEKRKEGAKGRTDEARESSWKMEAVEESGREESVEIESTKFPKRKYDESRVEEGELSPSSEEDHDEEEKKIKKPPNIIQENKKNPRLLPPRPMPSSAVCNVCLGFGHMSWVCPSPVICFICGGYGHKERVCPSRRCLRCSGRGHFASECFPVPRQFRETTD